MRLHTTIACLASFFVALALSPGCSSGTNGFDGGTGGSSSSSSSSTGSSTGSGGSSSGNSTSSSGSSSGSSGGSSGSSSGSSGGSGTSSSGSSSSSGGMTVNDAGIPYCNKTPCDLTSNTCCVTQLLTGSSCISHNQSCPSMTASFSCLQQSDCTTAGQVCCGAADSNAQTAATTCKTVQSGGSPCGTSTPSAAYAQVCTMTRECKNGMQCIPQVCTVVINGVSVQAHLTMCGLQTQAPFNCAKS